MKREAKWESREDREGRWKGREGASRTEPDRRGSFQGKDSGGLGILVLQTLGQKCWDVDITLGPGAWPP